MPPSVVAFDLDDTLWPMSDLMQRAERRMMAWLAERAPSVSQELSLHGLRALRDAVARERPDLAHDYSRQRLISLRRALRAADEDPDLAEEAFAVFYEARNRVRLFEDALPCLDGLQGRYRLGSISNGNADLRRIGLAERFSFSVHARQVGCLKPDRRIFEAALDAAGTGPERMVYVGDDPALDVAGAAAVGMKTVWLNRERRRSQDGVRADREISGLDQLEAALAGL